MRYLAQLGLDGASLPLYGVLPKTETLPAVSAVGKVYNLKRASDFAGPYVAGTAAGTIGGGAGVTTMRNENGVVINLRSVSEGADLRLAVSGMQVTLLKGK